MRIIDAHAHVASTRYIPRSFVEGTARNTYEAVSAVSSVITLSQIVDRFLSALQDHDCNALLKQMDAAHIDQTVLLCPDFTYALRDGALTIEEMLKEHAVLIRRHPTRLLAFAGVDPRWGRDGLQLFQMAAQEWGFSGLKLYPPCGYSPSDPMLFPFYEICRDRRMPVMVHIGPTSSALTFQHGSPLLIDVAAQTFPGVNFILAHAATHYTEECAAMCRYRPNVFCDISGYQQESGDWAGGLSRLLTSSTAHKVLFGTDWPVFSQQGSQEEFVKDLVDTEQLTSLLSTRQIEQLLSGNASRIIPDLALRRASSES